MATSTGRLRQTDAPGASWHKWRLPVVGVVLLVLAAAGGTYALKRQKETAQRDREAAIGVVAKGIANESSQRFRQRLAAVEAAVPLATLADVVSSADPVAIRTTESELATLDDAIVAVRLLPVGFDQVDYDAVPPLTYAALDQLQRSEEQGEPVSPEVHLLGSDGEYVAVLRRLEDAAGELVGHLLLALDVSVLSDLLEGANVRGGYAVLVQPVDKGRPLALAELGQKRYQRGAPSFSAVVPATSWELKYWAKGGGASTDQLLPGDLRLWGIAGGGIVVLTATVVLLARRRRNAQRAESIQRVKAWQRRVVKPEQLSEKLAEIDAAPASTTPRDESAPGIVVTEEGPPASPGSGPGPDPEPDGEFELEIVTSAATEPAASAADIDESIFRAYDIRGVVGASITEETVCLIGKAIGSEAYDRGQQTLAVACDGRESGAALKAALIDGLLSTGRDVIDVGRLPTPVLYFATHYLNTGSGVMVTGSHNPPDYNGLKIVLGGDTLFGEDIAALRQRIVSGEFATGEGTRQSMEVIDEYIRRISEDVPVALGNSFKLVIDCGNGVAGDVAPKLFRALGHDVVDLYCDVDGRFPNHHPDPSQPQNLRDLIAKVKETQADVGFAFDGDGDRLGVVDSQGHIVWPDRQLMLFAVDVLRRNPGAEIIFDVKCSSRLPKIIKAKGGKPVMCQTGHSYLKNKLKETGAPLAGEMSGHIFFKERWYGFDDAVYAAARMLEILMNVKHKPSEIFAKLPAGVSTPELRVDMAEGRPHAFVEELRKEKRFAKGKVTTIDGVRVDFKDSWGLVRASNTTPSLVLRFEGDDQAALERVQEKFRSVLLEVDPGLDLPF